MCSVGRRLFYSLHDLADQAVRAFLFDPTENGDEIKFAVEPDDVLTRTKGEETGCRSTWKESAPGIEPPHETVIGIARRRLAQSVDPTFAHDPLTAPSPMIENERSEPCVIAAGNPQSAAPMRATWD